MSGESRERLDQLALKSGVSQRVTLDSLLLLDEETVRRQVSEAAPRLEQERLEDKRGVGDELRQQLDEMSVDELGLLIALKKARISEPPRLEAQVSDERMEAIICSANANASANGAK